MNVGRDELLAACVEESAMGVRVVVAACPVDRQGEPIGDFEQVSVSPWYSGAHADQCVRNFYFDAYRERQGYPHPEDLRYAFSVPERTMVFSIEADDSPVHMRAGGVGAQPPRGRC